MVWEGINVAAAHKLDNMIVFVDDNNWQSGGAVDKTIGSRNIKERFESFVGMSRKSMDMTYQ